MKPRDGLRSAWLREIATRCVDLPPVKVEARSSGCVVAVYVEHDLRDDGRPSTSTVVTDIVDQHDPARAERLEAAMQRAGSIAAILRDPWMCLALATGGEP